MSTTEAREAAFISIDVLFKRVVNTIGTVVQGYVPNEQSTLTSVREQIEKAVEPMREALWSYDAQRERLTRSLNETRERMGQFALERDEAKAEVASLRAHLPPPQRVPTVSITAVVCGTSVDEDAVSEAIVALCESRGWEFCGGIERKADA